MKRQLYWQIDGISGYHSLSRKVIKEVIEYLLETNYNQMQIFQMNGYFGFNKNDYRGKLTFHLIMN